MVAKKVVAGGSALALLLAVPFIGQWEGKSNTPYKDIVGVETVCYGETRVKMRKYSNEECIEMLEKAVEKDFMNEVLKMTPTLKDRPYQLAAATSLAYNIGLSNYKGSTARRMFLAGRYKEGCEAFMRWVKVTKNGKLVEVKGLVNRRRAEVKELCLKDL